MNWMLRFLPAEKRAMVQLISRITSRLDTAEERRDVIQYGIEMFSNGKVSVGSWAQFGARLGILGGRTSHKKRRVRRLS